MTTIDPARTALLDARSEILTQLEILEADLHKVDGALAALGGELRPNEVPMPKYHTGKYRPLWEHLRESDADELTMTFDDIEEVLGFPLPPSSRKHLPHWYSYDGSAVVRAIHDAGYRASQVDVDSETVRFTRAA